MQCVLATDGVATFAVLSYNPLQPTDNFFDGGSEGIRQTPAQVSHQDVFRVDGKSISQELAGV